MALPYPKGLIVITKILHIVLVYLFRCFCIHSLVLNKWYQSTFLDRHCGQIFFIFAEFFPEKKKEGRDIPENFNIFLCKICRNKL
jgi:hypothetical protein